MEQVPLTKAADYYLALLMQQGHGDPARVVEEALGRMVKNDLGELEEDSEEMIAWMQREVAIGAEQLDRGQFSPLSPSQIKAEVLAAYQHRQTHP